MKQKKLKVSYDGKGHVLSVSLNGKKSIDSDVRGNVVIDYDVSGNISSVHFYDINFSAFKENKKALKDFAEREKASLSSR